ncbi:MAG: S1 family peptidase [Gemmatimonadaceae bacterium]
MAAGGTIIEDAALLAALADRTYEHAPQQNAFPLDRRTYTEASIDTNEPKKVRVDPLTLTSLFIVSGVRDNVLGTATGFVVRWKDRPFLVTNWHVLTGRHAETGKPLSDSGALPDEIAIYHHSGVRLGQWVLRREPLYRNGQQLWLQHPKGQSVDVAVLPLTQLDGVELRPLELELASVEMETLVGMPVSIVGFPLGLKEPVGFAIWKTGHIATDPDVPRHGLPLFLVDATTRSGMSGSPVILRRSDGIALRGDAIVAASPSNRFLGVYSSRLNSDDESLELGNVWKPDSILDVLATAV